MKTKQTDLWSGNFGKEYTDRNTRTPEEWDRFYKETWGVTKLEMNEMVIGQLKRDIRILEVGCNTGMQLNGLQRMGFENLYGIELQPYAVEQAKKFTSNINIIQGSGFDIPFKDNYFDLVITNGVLIHISPTDLPLFLKEIYRCSKECIAGFEYYSPETKAVNYRGKDDYLWKADYVDHYLQLHPDLKVIEKKYFDYQDNSGNVDCMFLLRK